MAKINERFCVSKLNVRKYYSIRRVMFKHLCLKEAWLIELNFQRKVKLAVQAMRVTDNLCSSLAYPKS